MLKHLNKKGWCPCKQAGWTIQNALDESSVTRKTAVCTATSTISGHHNTATIDQSTNITNNITVNLPPSVFPSGSEAERAYLKKHADAIMAAIVAGSAQADPDILTRFVRETWCSDEHGQLNNVVALSTRGNEFVILQMRDGKPAMETVAGKGAPGKLVDIAQKIMHQFAVDASDGYDPTRYCVPCYEGTYTTPAEAEEERARWGRGVVCKMEVLGRGPHEGAVGCYWINNRAAFVSAPPAQDTELTRQAEKTARVRTTLARRPREKRDVEAAVSCQLRHAYDKGSKRARLQVAAGAA